MNFCGKRERRQNPSATTGLPCSFHHPEASHSEQNSSGEKPGRVKRHRTRRERNYVKFGRNSTDSVLEQRPRCRGLQKALPPFWSSQLTSCDKPASFKGMGGAKPVIITQNRLSQHLGMFNKEVKSVNIERLLNPRCREELEEVTPLQRDTQVGEESQTGKSAASDQRSVPCEQLGCSVNNPCGKNEDSSPIVPTVSAAVIEHCSAAPVHTTDPGSQSSAAPAAVEVTRQSELQMAEADPCPSDALVVTNEKENVPPASSARAKSHKGKSLARELAHDLEKLLDLKAIFPGRNLVKETRQTVIRTLLEQKQKLPDFSALARYKELASSSKGDSVQAGFKTPAGRVQEWSLASKSSGKSRNSGQDGSLNKKRGQDLFFFSSPIPSPAHTAGRMDGGRPSLREDMDFFAEPDGFDRQSFGSAVLQHHPHRLSSRHMNPTAKSPLASDRQCPPQEALLRTAWPWEQGLRDVLREPQSRQERTKAAYRPLQKSAAQRHCLPFSTWDSWSSASANTGDRCPSQFPVIDSQQYSYVNELGSEHWSLQEADPHPAHSLHFSQEQWDSQTLGVGLRATERAAESQTSFDVLKSIWSPNVPSSEDTRPVPRALGCSFLTHQPPSLRVQNSNQEEFLQLYSINPEQNCCSHRQNPQREIRVPCRHSPNGHRVSSGLARSRTHHQKFALGPGRTSNSYQLWGPMLASVRTQASSEKGRPASRIQVCSQERLSQIEGYQQLRLFQQLPMSYFPHQRC